jgi:hypothetical protein
MRTRHSACAPTSAVIAATRRPNMPPKPSPNSICPTSPSRATPCAPYSSASRPRPQPDPRRLRVRPWLRRPGLYSGIVCANRGFRRPSRGATGTTGRSPDFCCPRPEARSERQPGNRSAPRGPIAQPGRAHRRAPSARYSSDLASHGWPRPSRCDSGDPLTAYQTHGNRPGCRRRAPSPRSSTGGSTGGSRAGGPGRRDATRAGSRG